MKTEEENQKSGKISKVIRIFLLVTVPSVWGIYFAAKVLKFQYQGYQSDLFSFIQMSRSWLQGRPLLYENCYGLHGRIHNYFLTLLAGPFVLWWGAYGIFIFQFLFYLLAIFYSHKLLMQKDQSAYRINSLLFYLVFFSGPLAYYVYNDPYYGFHAELMYVPLGVIFAVSLLKNDRIIKVISALAIVLVKEDGAVLGACIHMLYGVWMWQRSEKNAKQLLYYVMPRLGMWLVLFVAGLWWLQYQHPADDTRLDAALKIFHAQPAGELKDYFSGVLLQFFMLYVPFLIYMLWLRNFKHLPALFLLLIPILLVNLLSAFVYYPAIYFCLAWAPRFALVFAFSLAALLLLIVSNPRPWIKNIRFNTVLTLALGVLLFVWQIIQLKKQLDFDWQKEAAGIFEEDDPANSVPHYSQLKKLSKILPEDYPIAIPFENFGYFHKHDFIWINWMHNAYLHPRIIICNRGTKPYLKNLVLLQSPDSVITKDLWIYFEKEDRKYLEEAGIGSAGQDQKVHETE